MRFRYQNTPPSLSAYVRTILLLEGIFQPDPPTLPLFTNGMTALLCRTEKDPVTRDVKVELSLFGKTIPASSWDCPEHTTIIVYFFYPFALATVFNVSAKTLKQGEINLLNWSPQKANALKTQIIYAATTGQLVHAVDTLLIHQVNERKNDCDIIRYATDQMMLDSGPDTLSAVLAKLKLNERTFQRIFKKYVGVTASQYRRICQFQQSFAHVKSGKYETLTDIAFDNGFADQSHFIRSFKDFTDLTPNDYLRSGLKSKSE